MNIEPIDIIRLSRHMGNNSHRTNVCLDYIDLLESQNAILREALERIAELPTLSAPLSWGIAREALQRAEDR